MTSTTNPAPVPPPGSWPAIAAGCTCSVQLVSAGGTFSGVIYRYADKARRYFVALNCPVHDPLPDPTMRPRTGAGERGDVD